MLHHSTKRRPAQSPYISLFPVTAAAAAAIFLFYYHNILLLHNLDGGTIFIVEARTSSSSSSSSIPRSTNARSIWYSGTTSSTPESNTDTTRSSLPPWNPSPKIDPHGFLTSKYRRIHGDWEWDYVHGHDTAIQPPTQGHAEQQKRSVKHDEDNDTNIPSTRRMRRRIPSQLQRQAYPRRHHAIGGRFQNIEEEPVYIRQVPGDGNCLFHSISVGLALLTNHTHVNMNRLIRNTNNNIINPSAHVHPSAVSSKTGGATMTTKYDLMHLHHYSRHLRTCAVKVLSKHPKRLLFLQGNEYLRARDLVSAAAKQYGMTPEEYCNQMRRDSYWGGGPEIVALCNYLKRPIHVYELVSIGVGGKEEGEEEGDEILQEDGRVMDGDGDEGDDEQQETRQVEEDMHGYDSLVNRAIKARSRRKECDNWFELRRMACFGSPKFDNCEALHILSADSRFPDVEPGKQLVSGNHFLVMFPEHVIETIRQSGEEALGTKGVDVNVRGGDDVGLFEKDSVSSFIKRHILTFDRRGIVWNVLQMVKAILLGNLY